MARRRGIGYLVRTRWFLTWLSMTVISLAMMAIIVGLDNPAVFPAALFYGALAAPLAFAVATHTRTGVADSVPPFVLVGTAVFGGGVALVFAGSLDSVFNLSGERILGVGFVEELAKFLPVLVVALAGRYLTKRSGVALGLASALGFAFLESMFYGLQAEATGGIGGAELNLIFRGLTEPFGHLAFTGVFCALAFGSWEKRGRVTLTPAVIGGYLLAAVLHSLFDASQELVSIVGPVVALLFPVVAVVTYLCFRSFTRDLTIPWESRRHPSNIAHRAPSDAEASVPQPRRADSDQPTPEHRPDG